MKHSLKLLSVTLTGAALLVLTACNGTTYNQQYPPAYVPPAVVAPGYGWVGSGYYGGVYYTTPSAYYASPYYRSVSSTVYTTPYGSGGVYHGAYNSGAYYSNSRGG